MKSDFSNTTFWIIIFSVSMAFFESAVVVYLREIYYPEGFHFPLKPISYDIAVIEFFREASTMLMLISIGALCGRNIIEKFACFLLSFGIWDIFYYVFLKILIGWPESLLTWDILFLIPVTWVGPVIGPVINSINMILLSGVLIYFTRTNNEASIGRINWLLLIAGALIVFISYTEEYSIFILERFSLSELLFANDNKALLQRAASFVPQNFKWYIYISGQVLLLAAVFLVHKRNRRLKKTGVADQNS